MDDKTTAQISVMVNNLMVAFLRKKIAEHKEYAIFYIQNKDWDTANFFEHSIKDMQKKRRNIEDNSIFLKSICGVQNADN